ncbi:class I SAM-dependent methyltransferase [Phytohabitans aurantiacus]|uniref:Methyltransferase type 12 domain-containing protein n=1 Tax=Phytohabitans aurantiacus TaxID=3016789 RepID=A0ABQ5QNC3_9ACTN|nr:class I SAM-dependent methyltransferase [Phytohabitans aurantiacus]GLH95734.1 hypothetical protein Pa4123_10060 [Phytohabitans aurantiacus]
MGIGTAIRHRMGRFEEPAAELYRSFFIDLEALVKQLSHVGEPKRILEIGCGDGALGQRLTQTFKQADYLGIDPAETAGRGFRGDTARAEFRSMTSSDLRAEAPDAFDLVVIVDVLHHVPAHMRRDLLNDAATLTAPGGRIVVKEWLWGRLIAGRLGYWADRYITGDKDVDFMTEPQLQKTLADSLPEFTVCETSSVRPWRENILLTLRRKTDD